MTHLVNFHRSQNLMLHRRNTFLTITSSLMTLNISPQKLFNSSISTYTQLQGREHVSCHAMFLVLIHEMHETHDLSFGQQHMNVWLNGHCIT